MRQYFRAKAGGEPSLSPFQQAVSAIQADKLSEAHHLLLKALQVTPQNIEVWLLLGWTAPNSATASFYFQHLLAQHPDNPLARELIPFIARRIRSFRSDAGADVNESKQIVKRVIAYLENTGAGIQTRDQVIAQPNNPPDNPPSESLRPAMPALQKRPEAAPLGRIGSRSFGIPASFRVPLAYLAALAIAEAVTALANPIIGLIMHGMILVTMILQAALASHYGEQKFLITLTLAPLIRVMSLSIPLVKFPAVYWYAMIGAPLFLAAFLILRMTGFDVNKIGINSRKLSWQLLIGASGIVLGYTEYLILRPTPLVQTFTWQQIWMPALILLIFTGLLEEFIFRGIIQRGAIGTVGRYGILYVAVLFAILHFGYKSVLDILFVFGVGLFFGEVVSRTGSIVGVTISHGLTNISLYLILPFLLNGSAKPAAIIPQPIDTAKQSSVVWHMPAKFIKIYEVSASSDKSNLITEQIPTYDSNAPFISLGILNLRAEKVWETQAFSGRADEVKKFDSPNAVYLDNITRRQRWRS